MRRVASQHADWLSLIEPSGAFLTLPVLRRVFPHGLDVTPPESRAAVRASLESLTTDVGSRTAWLRFLLFELLELGPRLVEGPAIPSELAHTVPERGVTLRPDYVLMQPAAGDTPARPRMLVCRWPLYTPLDRKPSLEVVADKWAATPLERAVTLCRETGVPLALVTDTERFALVWAPRNGAAGWAVWPASLFAEERVLLDSFVSVLNARRFFGVAAGDTLEALFQESASAQAEVTGQLGRQVQEAVDLLVGAISRGDRAYRGQLLAGVSEAEVYEAAVTVMMRLVFLLCAEERRLFPVDDELYAQSYAITTLRAQLREQADREGAEVLEYRHAAWHRVLATFRAVFGGIQHERLRMPPYGGRLFDPDRFAFLEGRRRGEVWRQDETAPLPVDDRTMLAVLDALQVLTFREGGVTEARHVSYRTLDIEQIGHVYEGLLEQGCVRARTTVLGLVGRRGQEPEVSLEEVEAQHAKGPEVFAAWLVETTGRTANQIRRLVAAEPDALRQEHVRAACEDDARVYPRVMPFTGLLRDDLRGLPLVFLGPTTYDDGRVPGALYVTKTSERRDSGTQYTTKDLADEVVRYALEPIVYAPGPAEDADAADWVLKPSAELLKLKVCDLAVGSGAILVAACRYLAERLVEAWQLELERGEHAAGLPHGLVPEEDMELLARRVVTDCCLLGVDRNPMAAEMAKLSLWLTTMSKERPFTFLDHAIHTGDSLLGVTSLEQVERFHIDPASERQIPFLAAVVRPRIEAALEQARRLGQITVLTQADASEKERLYREMTDTLADLHVVADLVSGAALSTAGKGARALNERLAGIENDVCLAFDPQRPEADRRTRLEALADTAAAWLDEGRPSRAPVRRPLHWPLAFPEVFLDPSRPVGFDAMVGNPPFLGGQRITGAMGFQYRQYLITEITQGRTGSADLVSYFFLRAASVSVNFGFFATNTISQGETREVGLDWLLANGFWSVFRAVKSRPWPGQANLEVAQIWMCKGPWHGTISLDNSAVMGITSSLTPMNRVTGLPYSLTAAKGNSFVGSTANGTGFIVPESEAQEILILHPEESEVLAPYLIGENLNESPTHSTSRWIVNFSDWEISRAQNFSESFRIVETRVKPERLRNASRIRREKWWRFTSPAVDLYQSIQSLARVIALARVSKTLQPAFVPSRMAFSEQVVVFAYDDEFHFGILSSAFHRWWAITRASTMRTDIRYTPTDCFETFPQPPYSAAVEAAGKALDDHRRPLMIDSNEGLTKTYNRVHNPAEQSEGIVRLRELHRALDIAVRDAYAWSDLDLDHGFHETSQGIRYTIGPTARTEVLDRLLELNHQRYAEEVAAGLHDKKKSKGRSKRGRAVVTASQGMFDGEEK